MKYDNSDLCWECTGEGVMIGNMPCKVCGGTGKVKQEKDNEQAKSNTQGSDCNRQDDRSENND
jgi:DnaJ-class molecular chaperone